MKVAGAVLAAGASRRMGRPKALLELRGRTFLEHLLQALAAGGCQPCMAVVAEPVEFPRAICHSAGAGCVVNPDPARGQISSLRCALQEATGADGLLVVLVDQAQLWPESVRAVRRALEHAPLAVASCAGRDGHPVAFARSLFERLLSPEADRGARELVAACRRNGQLALVELDDPGVLRNLNTPADYQVLLDAQAGDGGPGR